MSRSTACSIAGVAVVVLVALLFLVRVDYAVLGPGPACNTVGPSTSSCPIAGGAVESLITVPHAYDHPSGSKLSLLTVSENNDRPSAASALLYWLDAGHAVVPRELEHPPGRSEQQVQQQNVKDMVQAQDNAVVAAELELGLVRPQVTTVAAGSPAVGKLQPRDLVESVDGRAVRSAAALLAAVSGGGAQTTYALTVLRGTTTLSVTVGKAVLPGSPDPKLGIGVQDFPTVPVTINLDANAIGGPSAGMMFALGTYDLLTPGDLAGSVNVAGTGTIGEDPARPGDPLAVGPIGGIQQKLYAAAHDVHATVFLAPVSNCSDTKGAIPAGLRVVPVSTLTDALAVLAKVRAGDYADLPHC